MEYLKIRNWRKWQSYRSDRGQPPWIKIHRCLMRDPEWVSLSDAERGQLVSMWLLAADHDGVIPASTELIQKLCFMNTAPDINKFRDLNFIESDGRHSDAKVTSTGRQSVTPETETETKTDKHTKNTQKEMLYSEYKTKIQPRRLSRQRCIKNLNSHLKKYTFDDLLNSIENYLSTLNGTASKYRKDPANFFGINEPFFIDYLPGNFEGEQPPELQEEFKPSI